MKRRAFIRSLGGAVAAAMVPFRNPLEILPAEKPLWMQPTWTQTVRMARHYSPEYLAALKQIVENEWPHP